MTDTTTVTATEVTHSSYAARKPLLDAISANVEKVQSLDNSAISRSARIGHVAELAKAYSLVVHGD